jgi:hypothetical protein
MNERDRNLQHAMMSFAYMGGISVSPRRSRYGRSPGLLARFIPFLRKDRD